MTIDRRVNNFLAAVGVLTSFACVVVAVHTVACGTPGVPSATDEAAVGGYGLALQGCIAQAKQLDAGLSFYESCAQHVDSMWNLHFDGGAP